MHVQYLHAFSLDVLKSTSRRACSPLADYRDSVPNKWPECECGAASTQRWMSRNVGVCRPVNDLHWCPGWCGGRGQATRALIPIGESGSSLARRSTTPSPPSYLREINCGCETFSGLWIGDPMDGHKVETIFSHSRTAPVRNHFPDRLRAALQD
jgi:hypothetical protein